MHREKLLISFNKWALLFFVWEWVISSYKPMTIIPMCPIWSVKEQNYEKRTILKRFSTQMRMSQARYVLAVLIRIEVLERKWMNVQKNNPSLQWLCEYGKQTMKYVNEKMETLCWAVYSYVFFQKTSKYILWLNYTEITVTSVFKKRRPVI